MTTETITPSSASVLSESSVADYEDIGRKTSPILPAEIYPALLVFERCADIGVTATVECPHFEGDVTTFLVGLGRLPLVESTDLLADLGRGISAGCH
ncbi:hypothetical protein [Halomarina litorea]|uniref:hypothetical protein n=1 Tax=Halomarina litorea TaxID=2961595 RepID=UPI0020C22292|nr:hypothetical protein [Halomarina sp. BCD28]